MINITVGAGLAREQTTMIGNRGQGPLLRGYD